MTDFRIEDYVHQVFGDYKGTFLEIGCWDGEHISQTAAIEREGWTGLCVDPFPRNFERRTCAVCAKAVSADGKPRPFVRVSIDRRYGGDVSYFSGFADSIEHHWPLIEEHCDYELLLVDTVTPAQLYAEYRLPAHVDFLSVDVEGAEREVFSAIDLSAYTYSLVMFEHNEVKAVRDEVGSLLCAHGYRLLDSLRIDDIYVRDPQLAKELGNFANPQR